MNPSTSRPAILAQLKRLKKPGDQFTVTNHKDRQIAMNCVRELRKLGQLTLKVTTREIDDGAFRVVAI